LSGPRQGPPGREPLRQTSGRCEMVPKRRERGGDVARTTRGNPGAVERHVTSRRGLSGTSGRPAAPVRYWRQRRRFCDRDSEAPAHPAPLARKARGDHRRRSAREEAARKRAAVAGPGRALERNSVATCPARPARVERAGCERANPQERSWSVRFERIGADSGRAKAKQTVEGVKIPEDGRCRRHGNKPPGRPGAFDVKRCRGRNSRRGALAPREPVRFRVGKLRGDRQRE
jgi:hypothetical protein